MVKFGYLVFCAILLTVWYSIEARRERCDVPSTNAHQLVWCIFGIRKDFYWQDYHGVIPEEALKAGQDQNNKPIYIGQVLDGEKIIPGKILENDQNIYYEFGERGQATNNNVKIFCTKNPEKYEWIPTPMYDVLTLRHDSVLVKGGFEQNFLTFIGRVRVGGNTEIGKVICEEERCLGLYTNRDGYSQTYHNFEILTYDPFRQPN